MKTIATFSNADSRRETLLLNCESFIVCKIAMLMSKVLYRCNTFGDYTLYKNYSQNLKANRKLVSLQKTSEMDLADHKMGVLVYLCISPLQSNLVFWCK